MHSQGVESREANTQYARHTFSEWSENHGHYDQRQHKRQLRKKGK